MNTDSRSTARKADGTSPVPASPRAPRFGWARNRRAGAVLEGALVLPILCLITFPMIEFAQAFYVKHVMESASRDGARRAILPTATHAAAITTVSNTMGAAGFPTSKYTLTFKNESGATIADVGALDTGNVVIVNVSASYANVGFPQWFLKGSGRTISGQTMMIKE